MTYIIGLGLVVCNCA